MRCRCRPGIPPPVPSDSATMSCVPPVIRLVTNPCSRAWQTKQLQSVCADVTAPADCTWSVRWYLSLTCQVSWPWRLLVTVLSVPDPSDGRDILVSLYRSPVKEWQVSWFVLGTITLSGTDPTVKRLDLNVKTFSADSSVIFANNVVCVIQSYCPKNKPADLPLFYWRPVQWTGTYIQV